MLMNCDLIYLIFYCFLYYPVPFPFNFKRLFSSVLKITFFVQCTVYTNVSVITNYVLPSSSGLQFPISAYFNKMRFYSAALIVRASALLSFLLQC